MSACPQCGHENKEEARFCVKCGATLAAASGTGMETRPPAEPAPPMPGSAPPPAQPSQPPYQQPAQYSQPAQPPGAYAQQQYAAPPAAPYPQPPTYAPAATKTRGGMFWVGAFILLIAGVMVLVSTWMSWGAGPGGFLSMSGWDWFDIGKAGGGGSGEVVNAFFIYSEGYPIFTGLCTLIIGGLIALAAVLMLVFRSKGLGALAILFSILALGMAITNLTTILRTENISMGVGMYVFLVFSFAGLVGGGISMSG